MPHESAATAPITLGFSAPPFHDPFHAPSSPLQNRGRPTFCFSGVADTQLRPNVREYVAVHGCVRALTTAVVAVVAVMVAVTDTSGPSASLMARKKRADLVLVHRLANVPRCTKLLR